MNYQEGVEKYDLEYNWLMEIEAARRAEEEQE